MSKKIIFFIIVIQIFFTKISYAQFTNPLDSIFNEIGKGIENVTKSISEGVQKSDDKNVDIKNELLKEAVEFYKKYYRHYTDGYD